LTPVRWSGRGVKMALGSTGVMVPGSKGLLTFHPENVLGLTRYPRYFETIIGPMGHFKGEGQWLAVLCV
jgi:hypothetical protein